MSKILLVTGGASGIGAAVARIAAERGFSVAINYRSRREQAESLVSELRSLGSRAVAIEADVAEPNQIQHLYARVKQDLGVPDAVLNSAGIATSGLRVEDATPAELTRLLHVNVLGVMLSCGEAARTMSTKNGGSGGVVINVSSMAATIGGRPGNSHYAASKAAVDAFSVGFAKEVAAEGIRVVSVRPGFTITDMTKDRLEDAAFRQVIAETIPLGRPARVEEVAAPIAWLLSNEASFITGTCLDISGGGFAIASAPRQG
ncbi:MAG: NAD(P)-dependent oxidoreductase [Polyangiaceae bacterium]|jgi:NAD(P)-dependent dehydrogenase (short-subunit alcohol dehydrogenase family)|nr:NAD(P)-dependent oxidoreductase [Polyangiaceae bacterium]